MQQPSLHSQGGRASVDGRTVRVPAPSGPAGAPVLAHLLPQLLRWPGSPLSALAWVQGWWWACWRWARGCPPRAGCRRRGWRPGCASPPGYPRWRAAEVQISHLSDDHEASGVVLRRLLGLQHALMCCLSASESTLNPSCVLFVAFPALCHCQRALRWLGGKVVPEMLDFQCFLPASKSAHKSLHLALSCCCCCRLASLPALLPWLCTTQCKASALAGAREAQMLVTPSQ